MRRYALALMMLMLAMSIQFVQPVSVTAQSAPTLQMGFATLASLIPSIVGQPTANERFDPATGQTIQPTTRGLLVWRKADNATAFTDGATTWILGPNGLEERPNDSLFAWERPVVGQEGTPVAIGPEAAVSQALQQLSAVPSGSQLVDSATQHGVLITVEPLPRSVLGAFVPQHNVVILSSQLETAPSKGVADVLAHELQHATDLATIGEPQTPAQCYSFEERAFFKQAQVWEELWNGNLPPSSNPLYAELNDVATTVETNPNAFVAQLVQRYRSECGPLP